MEPETRPLSRALARALWALALLNGAAGTWLWWPDASKDTGDRPALHSSGPDLRTLDLDEYVEAPPRPGAPDPVAVDRAIERGVQAFLERFIEPWLEPAEAGGFLDYVHADGREERLGPGVYVQCQLYLLIHLLMYHEEFELAASHPLVERVHRWLLDTMEPGGRWSWSEEGCLHPKALIVLARFGDREQFEAAWGWAVESDLYLRSPHHARGTTGVDLFTIRRSGAIVQTLGPAAVSLSGEHEWEHGSPVPDEENTAKFLYALLLSGRHPDSPEVTSMQAALSRHLVENNVALGQMNTKDVIGRCWYVLLHQRFRLRPDAGYRLSLAVLRRAVEGEWETNFLMRVAPLARALMVRALLEAGDRGPALDAIVNGFVAAQTEDGIWPAPAVTQAWGFRDPPAEGYKFGSMDGANTYLVALALIGYRDRILR